MLQALLHFGLYLGLCAAPAFILLPLRYLDREPSNEIVHEQPGDDQDQEPDGMLTAA